MDKRICFAGHSVLVGKCDRAGPVRSRRGIEQVYCEEIFQISLGLAGKKKNRFILNSMSGKET